MLIKIRKTGEGNYFIDGNTYFLFGSALFVFKFLLSLLFTQHFVFSLTFASTLTLFIIAYIYWNDQRGKKKHKNIIQSKLFTDLKLYGLDIENAGDYWGLIGEYKQYCVRIYYDWNKTNEGFFSFGDIVLMLYHQPVLVQHSKDQLDLAKLEEMNLPFRNQFGVIGKLLLSKYCIRFTPNYAVKYINYYPFTSAEKIIKNLDEQVQLALTNGLKSMSKAEIEAIEVGYKHYFAPGIETFQY